MNPVQESVSQQIMADSNSFLEQDHSLTPAIVVTVSAAIALVANYYGMLHGITIVIPHLLYLPVVFCAFFFPRRGVIFSLVLSALYLLMTDLLLPGDTSSLISAASRCIILIIIAIVVSYLSGSLAKRERTIRAAKEEWERTFDAIPDLIALIDGQHRIIRINRAMAERLGMSPDKAVGLHCYEIVHHSDLPPSFCPHAKLLQDGEEHSEEFHEDTLGGDFMVTASPLFDENGALAGSVHIARDITEQLSSQQKIRQLAAIVRYSTDAIISMDLEGTITSWNAGAAAIYGYDEDEITGNNVTVLIPENLRNEVRQLLDRVRQGEHIDHYETVRIRKNRVSIPVSLTESPILDARGTVVGASVIAQDITERKRAESALIQANRKLNILSSITRHDILNKITALYAYLDISRDL